MDRRIAIERECRKLWADLSTEMLPSGPALAEHIFGGYYRVSSKPVGVMSRAASAASTARSMTRGRLYADDTRVERLVQDLSHATLALRQFIRKLVGREDLFQGAHAPCVSRPPA
jgi:hypothetical protein